VLDLELLRSFVSVVDAGGFTRAGERVHRTQSTVSQQIKRLEEALGRPLLERNGKETIPTEEGERLLFYARRILALAEEARDVVSRPAGDVIVRLGIPEDFAAYRLTELLSEFVRSRPGLRLDVRCDLSVRLRHDLDRGELDAALIKREAGEKGGIAAWPEHLRWVAGTRFPLRLDRRPVPLAVFQQGCLYRNRAIHMLERAERAWHIAYVSPNLVGVQAAVSAGLGISILPQLAVLPDHRILAVEEGFAPIGDTEVALMIVPGAGVATRSLADLLIEFCSSAGPRGLTGIEQRDSLHAQQRQQVERERQATEAK
jgi:DNA-binding transcriptional LysR family regulator